MSSKNQDYRQKDQIQFAPPACRQPSIHTYGKAAQPHHCQTARSPHAQPGRHYGQHGRPNVQQASVPPGQPKIQHCRPYGRPGQTLIDSKNLIDRPAPSTPAQHPYDKAAQPNYRQTIRSTSGQPSYGQPGQPKLQPCQPYGRPGQAVVISQPGQAGLIITQPRPKQNKKNTMIWSILACLFCCSPTGICAIYYAHRANTLANMGHIEEANRMTTRARRYIAISVALVFILIFFVFIIFVSTPLYFFLIDQPFS